MASQVSHPGNLLWEFTICKRVGNLQESLPIEQSATVTGVHFAPWTHLKCLFSSCYSSVHVSNRGECHLTDNLQETHGEHNFIIYG